MYPLPSFRLLGVKVHAVQIPDAIVQMEEWIREHDACHYVAVTGMHGVMEAQHDLLFKKILNTADLVVSDGMPLVWAGRRYGFPMKRRVYGPELMLTFCQQTAEKGYRHYFYGGASDVPGELANSLRNRFPGMNIAGTYSPPFRPLTDEEDEEVVARINQSKADVLWVGLSTPKQERWMYEHRNKLNVPVLMGVGAAFDLNAGTRIGVVFSFTDGATTFVEEIPGLRFEVCVERLPRNVKAETVQSITSHTGA
jgi:N-acetylglucosaminyldiphosphoundecaprenol N-acetyl-beta-D-mannosaminyltransferase